MRNLLETLVEHGFHCSALTGTFSPAVGQTLGFGHAVDLTRQLTANGIRNRKPRNVQGFPVLSFSRNRVKMHTFTIESEMRSHLYCQELALHTVLSDIIRETKPDLVLTSSRVQALNTIAKTAEDFNLPVAAYISTTRPVLQPDILQKVKHVLVSSLFLVDYYRKQYGIECEPLWPIIRTPPANESRRGARFITMINPAPEKGITMFRAIAQQALYVLPQARFLIVEGRWTVSNLQQKGVDLRLPNITITPNELNLRRIFRCTSILLYPSYWEETYGRTILEAQSFGIPVLASRRGGIAEALDGGGFLIDLPRRLTTNYMTVPSHRDLTPWMERLRVLLTVSSARQTASRVARRAARQIADRNVKRAVSLFSTIAQ
jgi:glycosyltransferase involved in cell wall biosynthesis